MGMQCHFKIQDLPDFTKQITYDFESDSYSYYSPSLEDSFDCTIGGNAWFDIGQMSISAMGKIKYLIQNRVPFNCS